jgi:hypothetical protein
MSELPPPPADFGPDNPRPGSEETLRAAEIRLLADRVGRFTDLHNALASTVSERLTPDVEDLKDLVSALRQDTAEQLAIQRAQLRQIMAGVPEQANPPVNWPALNSVDAALEWEKLGDWIAEVFVPWYRVTRTQLPDCWALHPDAMLELSWLRSAHVDAYLPTAAPDRAATWHTRWRPAVLLRLREVAPESSCPPGEHLLTEEQRARRDEHGLPDDDSYENDDYEASGQTPLPHEQLAERHHWQRFYEQAVEADLAWRPEPEAEAREAAPQ